MGPDISTKSIVTSKKYAKGLSLIHFSLSGALNNEALLPQSRNIPYAWPVAILRIMSDKIAMISSFDIRELYRESFSCQNLNQLLLRSSQIQLLKASKQVLCPAVDLRVYKIDGLTKILIRKHVSLSL